MKREINMSIGNGSSFFFFLRLLMVALGIDNDGFCKALEDKKWFFVKKKVGKTEDRERSNHAQGVILKGKNSKSGKRVTKSQK